MEPITELIARILRAHEEKTGSELRLSLIMDSTGQWDAEVTELNDGWTGQLGASGADPTSILFDVEAELSRFLDYYVG